MALARAKPKGGSYSERKGEPSGCREGKASGKGCLPEKALKEGIFTERKTDPTLNG